MRHRLTPILPANDDLICTNILEQISRVAVSLKDAEKANERCQSRDYDLCWLAVQVEKIELRRLLIDAGIDWTAFERSFA